MDPAGRQEAYDYDTAGHLIRTTDPGGHITSYTYNSSGRQSKISTLALVDRPGLLLRRRDLPGLARLRGPRLASSTCGAVALYWSYLATASATY